MTRLCNAPVQEIHAAVLRNKGGPLKIESLELEAPREDEVLVRVVASGIATAVGRGALPGGRKAIGIIQGDAVPQRFIPRLIELYRAGEFPFDRLVRFYDFAEINGAMNDARSGKTIKPVLRIGNQ